MRDFDPQVGDRVRFRSWEDMAEEFGEENGNIDTGAAYFTNQMRYLCGTEFEIEKIEGSVIYGCPDDRWYITVGMLEPVEAEFNEVYDTEEIDKFIKTFIRS